MSIYKCCRYCKHYFSGYCENETVLRQLQVEDAIYAVAESGKLAEVLYEAELPWDPMEDEEKISALEGAIEELYGNTEFKPVLAIRQEDEFFCSEWE